MSKSTGQVHQSSDGVIRSCSAQTKEACRATTNDGTPARHFESKEAAEAVLASEAREKHGNFTTFKGSAPHATFKNIKQREFKQVQADLERLAPMFENYDHDYDAYNPDERDGEREFVENYDASLYTSEKTSYTADNVILWRDPSDAKLKVLMIKRGGHPFKGAWAHPGGFIDTIRDENGDVRRESREEAAARELEEETKVKMSPSMMVPVATYDRPGRDPRMDVHMNTHVVVISESLDFSPSDDADDAEFVPIEEIYDGSREIAFDHRLSIKDALNFVRRA